MLVRFQLLEERVNGVEATRWCLYGSCLETFLALLPLAFLLALSCPFQLVVMLELIGNLLFLSCCFTGYARPFGVAED